MFPGSFSPLQVSHLRAAALAKAAVEAQNSRVHSIRLSAVNDGYGKKGLLPWADRSVLAQMLLEESQIVPGACMDPWEAEQPRFLQTFHVARHFSEAYKQTGKADKVLMMGGADLFDGMFAAHPTPSIPYPWSKESVSTLIMELDGIVIIQRTGAMQWDPESIRAKLQTKLAGTEAAARLASFDIIVAMGDAGDGSSTRVRKLITEGPSKAENRAGLVELIGEAATAEIVRREDYFIAEIVRDRAKIG